MNIYTDIIVAFWIVFLAYWLISAFSAKRSVGRNIWRWLAMRLVLAVVVISLFGTQISDKWSGMQPTAAANPILAIIGTILCGLGIALAIWARIYLGRNWGMPMSVKEEPELVTGGPYARVRHPIYTGVLLAMFGSALVAGLQWFVPVVLSAICFIYAAKREEKNMAKEFPEAYPAYKKRSKMLIPFIF